MKHAPNCLTCGHPVDTGDPGVAVIMMSRQPRYYHTSPSGCIHSERTHKYAEETLEDVNLRLKLQEERKEMITE